jgi:hypothetical protein
MKTFLKKVFAKSPTLLSVFFFIPTFDFDTQFDLDDGEKQFLVLCSFCCGTSFILTP